MREKKYHIYVDSQDRRIILHSLVELKNQLIQQGRYTDCIDEIIFKVTSAAIKKVKVILNVLCTNVITGLNKPDINRNLAATHYGYKEE